MGRFIQVGVAAVAICLSAAAYAQTSELCSRAYLNSAGCNYEKPLCESSANLSCRSNCLDTFVKQCSITNPEPSARKAQLCCRACNQQFCR